jgi:hypothetical protein
MARCDSQMMVRRHGHKVMAGGRRPPLAPLSAPFSALPSGDGSKVQGLDLGLMFFFYFQKSVFLSVNLINQHYK